MDLKVKHNKYIKPKPHGLTHMVIVGSSHQICTVLAPTVGDGNVS